MTLLGFLKKWQQKRRVKKFYEQNRWYGFIPGDILQCKDKRIMYLGLNKNGGPGMAGFPEPIFGPPHPKVPVSIRYYLRPATGIFREGEAPVEAGSTGIKIAFINAAPGDFEKIDHITPEKWRSMKDEEFTSIATSDSIPFVIK